jgi:V-type H+-transporting ATPase subunit F
MYEHSGQIEGEVLIAGQLAEQIRDTVDKFQDAFPAVLEIPSKDHPYDPEKDSVLRRVRRLFGE